MHVLHVPPDSKGKFWVSPYLTIFSGRTHLLRKASVVVWWAYSLDLFCDEHFFGRKRTFWEEHSLWGRGAFCTKHACWAEHIFADRRTFRYERAFWDNCTFSDERTVHDEHTFWYVCIMVRAYLFSRVGTSISFGSFCVGRACLLGLAHVLARAYRAHTLWNLFGVNIFFRRGFWDEGIFWDERTLRDAYFLGRGPRQVTEKRQVEEDKGR